MVSNRSNRENGDSIEKVQILEEAYSRLQDRNDRLEAAVEAVNLRLDTHLKDGDKSKENTISLGPLQKDSDIKLAKLIMRHLGLSSDFPFEKLTIDNQIVVGNRLGLILGIVGGGAIVSLINYTLSNSDVESLATMRGINSKESLDEYNGGNDNLRTIDEDDTFEANMTRHTVFAVGVLGDQQEQQAVPPAGAMRQAPPDNVPQEFLELSNEVTDSFGQLEDERHATKITTSELAPILMQSLKSPVVPEGFSIVEEEEHTHDIGDANDLEDFKNMGRVSSKKLSVRLHRVEMIACEKCDYMTARLGMMQKHVAKMHGGRDLNNQGSEDSDSTVSEDEKPLIRLKSAKTKKRKRGRQRKDEELTVKDNSIRRKRSRTRNKPGSQQLWKVTGINILYLLSSLLCPTTVARCSKVI